jgi:hypothetical protein
MKLVENWRNIFEAALNCQTVQLKCSDSEDGFENYNEQIHPFAIAQKSFMKFTIEWRVKPEQ